MSLKRTDREQPWSRGQSIQS